MNGEFWCSFSVEWNSWNRVCEQTHVLLIPQGESNLLQVSALQEYTQEKYHKKI